MKLTICGSLTFKEKMIETGNKLKALGHQIHYPEIIINQELTDSNLDKDELRIKHDLIKKHFNKIEQSDGVIIINPEKNGIPDYIGSNTLIEMGVAYYLNKKIYLLNDMPRMEHLGEIRAMGPIVLNKDLQIIN